MSDVASGVMPDVVRMNTIRAAHVTELEFKGVDPVGHGVLGEVLMDLPVPERSTAFAIAASLFASQRPVYFSFSRNALSTDPTFGATPSLRPDFAVTGKLRVEHIDGIWRFPDHAGVLVLTLEDGPLVHFAVGDASAFIGWLHMTRINGVTFDGTRLATVEPRIWPAGAFVAPT